MVGLVELQKAMSVQMASFAQATLAGADAREEWASRIAAAQERQADLLAEAFAFGAPAMAPRTDMVAGEARGGPRFGGLKGAADGSGARLEQSLAATQALMRDVLKRLDETRRDDRRMVRALTRREDELATHLGALVDHLALVLSNHDLTSRDKLDRLKAEIEALQRGMKVDFKRLEAHVAQTRTPADGVQSPGPAVPLAFAKPRR